MSRVARIAWWRAGVVIGAVVLLELLCRAAVISRLVVLPPSEMAATLWALIASGQINRDMIQTFSTVAAAFALSVVAGCLIGALVHRMPRARRAIDPLLASYYSIPFFVFYPLLIALFGLSTLPLIVIGFIFATGAMVIATLNGLDRVPRVLLKTARIHRLGRVRSVALITLPAAAPYLFTGLKLALAYSFIGIIAGEFILSGGGLGRSIADAYESFDNETMYALMLFVLLIVTAMNMGLHVWEQSFLRRRARQ